MPKLPRVFYVMFRVFEMMVSLLSRFINAAFLGGSTHQTTSARAHIETSRGWRIGRRVINALFFWQADHCAWAHANELDQARKTIARAGERMEIAE